jgi:hypothetical protein
VLRSAAPTRTGGVRLVLAHDFDAMRLMAPAMLPCLSPPATDLSADLFMGRKRCYFTSDKARHTRPGSAPSSRKSWGYPRGVCLALLHPWRQILDSPLEREVIALTHDDIHVAIVVIDKCGAQRREVCSG